MGRLTPAMWPCTSSFLAWPGQTVAKLFERSLQQVIPWCSISNRKEDKEPGQGEGGKKFRSGRKNHSCCS